jgi:hypothetical protein
MTAKLPIFSVSNHHAPTASGHIPPLVDGDRPDIYHGYFENVHGEQSIYVDRRDTGQTLVYSGDAEWAAFRVVNGSVDGLVLSPDEQLWLQACVRACGLTQR